MHRMVPGEEIGDPPLQRRAQETLQLFVESGPGFVMVDLFLLLLQGAFSLVKSPLLPPLGGNSPEKYASQDQAFRPLRRAAKGSAFGNRDFLKKIE